MNKREDFPMAHAGMVSQISLQETYFDEGKVFILQIESTLQCFQLCKYCYAGSTPASSNGLSSNKIRELLNSAANLEVKMIDWLGGDPLVRSDWYELCNYATDLGLINNIWTSGIPLSDPEVAKKAVEVSEKGFISTHLDTVDPNLYLGLHGSDCFEVDSNNIKLIIKGIENTIAAGKDPESMVNCITFTTPLANGRANNMIDYMQNNFGIKTCLTLFNPVILSSLSDDWEPSRTQIENAFAYRDKINYPDDPSCGVMDVSKFYCGTSLCIKADGWLTPCSVIKTIEFGNVNDDTLENLIEKKKDRLLFLDFRDLSKLPGNCGSCVNNSHCFGCRSSAYYYGGDVMAADPKCYQFTPDLNKKE